MSSEETPYSHIDLRLFEIADAIAEEHVPRRWFDDLFSMRRLVRKIRLRQAIYNALVVEGPTHEQ